MLLKCYRCHTGLKNDGAITDLLCQCVIVILTILLYLGFLFKKLLGRTMHCNCKRELFTENMFDLEKLSCFLSLGCLPD